MSSYIDWNTLELRKTSGMEKLRCPNCDEQRSDKKNKSLSVYHNNGIAKCFYCDAVSIRDYEQVQKPREYKLPVQQWQNFTNLSDDLVKWFSKRGISQQTLIDNKITEEKYYQPAEQKEVNNVVFNYFEGDTIVNKKYRSGKKKFTQSAGTKNIFYGLNDIIGSKEVYIVEGEIDKLSLWEIGIKNCISVPNGANDNDDVWSNCKKYVEDVEKFYIATDNDTKGDEVAEKIVQRLGKWRCERVQFKNKDANDDLSDSKLILESSIRNTKKYPVSGAMSVTEYYNEVLELYDKGLPDTIAPKGNGLKFLAENFSIMKGQLTVVTGIPSHGKSNFFEWYILNLLVEYDNMKLSMYSPEHSPYGLHQTNFIQKFYGQPFFQDKDGVKKVTKKQIENYFKWSKERLYVSNPEGKQKPDWDWIFQTFTEQVYAYGVDIFLIDAFNKVLLPSGGNKKDQIDEILTRLTSFAQQNNVAVFLVAHPTKMRKNDEGIYECPTLYDVAGSADFRNQTHNGAAIYRDFNPEDPFTKFVNLKTKFSFQGEIGSEYRFKYDPVCGRYYDFIAEPNREPLVYFDELELPQPEINLETGEVEELAWERGKVFENNVSNFEHHVNLNDLKNVDTEPKGPAPF